MLYVDELLSDSQNSCSVKYFLLTLIYLGNRFETYRILFHFKKELTTLNTSDPSLNTN
jgi:hypothetical protein